ncbi:MAG TPA: hypothetical protein VIH57_08425 [Bacteroidales bacterium]
MEKKELLKTIGFSDLFLEKLSDFEKDNVFQIHQNSFSNQSFNYSTRDTSDYFVKDSLKKDSNNLTIK